MNLPKFLPKFGGDSISAGLDIDEERIHVVQLKKETDGFSVKAFATIATPEGCVNDGEILDPKQVAEAVKKLLKKAKIAEKKFSVVIHSSQLIFRVINHAVTDRKNLAAELKEEVDRYVLFAGLDTMIGYQVLDQQIDEGQKKIKILLAAVTADIINSYRVVFRNLGLSLDGVTISAISLISAFDDQSMKFDLGEVKMLAVVDNYKSYFMILSEGKIGFVHTADFGLIDFSIEKFKESYKRTVAFRRGDGGGDIAKAVVYVSKPAIKEEIEKSKEELQSEFEWGWGTVARDQATESQVAEFEPLMPSIGAAKAQKLPIDFLPSSAKTEFQARKTFMLFVYFIAAFCVGMIVLFGLLKFRMIMLEKEINNIKKEIEAPSVAFDAISELKTQIDDLTSLNTGREDMIAKKKEQLQLWMTNLKNLGAVIPPGTRITSVTFATINSISMQGESYTSVKVFQFKQELQKLYADVKLDFSVSPGKGGAESIVSFSINGSR